MSLLREWDKDNIPAEITEEKPKNQQEISNNNKIFAEEADEIIHGLDKNGKINPQQKNSLELTKNCILDLCPENLEEQRRIFKLEVEDILGTISVGNNVELIGLEMDPKSYHQDKDNIKKIRTTISNLYNHEKETLNHLLHSQSNSSAQ